MYVPVGFEKWAEESVKTACPFEYAEKLTSECARNAVRELDTFNQKYTNENTWLDDGSYFKSVPMDNAEIERATAMLSRYLMLLLHRRGLVGF
jgi:hypothetical protein